MSLRGWIERLCLNRLGRSPNLENPTGYNDLIQWLKIHDQRREHITACDKWAVRKTVPEKHLIPAKLGIAPDLVPGFVKCTHDSGSAKYVRNWTECQTAQIELAPRLSQPYGREKGEWAYQFVLPRLITEQCLKPGITDYKFHCSHGKVRWVQVIWNRPSAHEAIFTQGGEITGLHMDHKMQHVPDQGRYPGDEAWSELTALAEHLAKPWRYVRVDLYWSAGQAWFGELTFWPLAGCYLTKDEPLFGEMLELDLTEKREPIVA